MIYAEHRRCQDGTILVLVKNGGDPPRLSPVPLAESGGAKIPPFSELDLSRKTKGVQVPGKSKRPPSKRCPTEVFFGGGVPPLERPPQASKLLLRMGGVRPRFSVPLAAPEGEDRRRGHLKPGN